MFGGRPPVVQVEVQVELLIELVRLAGAADTGVSPLSARAGRARTYAHRGASAPYLCALPHIHLRRHRFRYNRLRRYRVRKYRFLEAEGTADLAPDQITNLSILARLL